jgi:hypothetical protein
MKRIVLAVAGAKCKLVLVAAYFMDDAMIKLLPAELSKSLKECLTPKAFDRDRFDEILAAHKGLHLFRRELIDDVYKAMVFRIERRRGRQIEAIRKSLR